jgi:hypothetical protein
MESEEDIQTTLVDDSASEVVAERLSRADLQGEAQDAHGCAYQAQHPHQQPRSFRRCDLWPAAPKPPCAQAALVVCHLATAETHA